MTDLRCRPRESDGQDDPRRNGSCPVIHPSPNVAPTRSRVQARNGLTGMRSLRARAGAPLTARTRPRFVAVLLVGAVILGACGGDDSEGSATTEAPTTADSTTSAPVTEPDTSTTSTDATTEPTESTDTTAPTTTAPLGDGEIVLGEDGSLPPGLLTIASGTTLVSATIGGEVDASRALRPIDGSDVKVTITNDGGGLVEFVYELAGPTTFDQFLIPGIVEQAGNATFFRDIEVAGSADSATDGFETLLDVELETLEPDEMFAQFDAEDVGPVRWVRVRMENGILIEHDPGQTNLEFTELIGLGTQEEVPLSTAFTGKWDFRFADAAERPGPTLELKQDGTTVSGCFDTTELTGTVTGPIARLQGFDTNNEDESVYLFAITADGELQGVESTNGGVFRPRVGPIAPADATTPCSDAPPPAPPSCDAIVYVNFDVNSADIRPDSEPVLDDLYEGVEGTEGSVVIEGHTSTEGTDEANLDLSQRRAQAVVDALVERGVDEARLEAIGIGEAEPLVTETDEASRAINRRVEIACE